MVKKVWRYDYPFRHNSRTWLTHRRTDTAWRHRPRLCIASRGNNTTHAIVPYFMLCYSVRFISICMNISRSLLHTHLEKSNGLSDNTGKMYGIIYRRPFMQDNQCEPAPELSETIYHLRCSACVRLWSNAEENPGGTAERNIKNPRIRTDTCFILA